MIRCSKPGAQKTRNFRVRNSCQFMKLLCCLWWMTKLYYFSEAIIIDFCDDWPCWWKISMVLRNDESEVYTIIFGLGVWVPRLWWVVEILSITPVQDHCGALVLHIVCIVRTPWWVPAGGIGDAIQSCNSRCIDSVQLLNCSRTLNWWWLAQSA